MHLPFFDLRSSARYITDLLQEPEQPFKSASLQCAHSEPLARELTAILPGLNIVSSEANADVAISYDLIHLLPPLKRTEHVKRLAELANREILIACPLGTDLQISIYRSLAKLVREQNLEPIDELNKVLEYGLPTPQDAANWAHGFTDLDFFYAGDVAFFQEQSTQFLWLSALSPWRRMLRKLNSAHAPSVSEEPLPPETVPMRRHRRLFLILRKR